MAFYGNITNTSKTTFQFDKTYSNRYEMDTHAGVDGVFVGRYVLVDYDGDIDENSYILDAGNEHVYLYENSVNTKDQHIGFNLYIGRPYEVIARNDGTAVFVGAHENTYYQFDSEADNGRCLMLLPGHVISDINSDYDYFKVAKLENNPAGDGTYKIHVSASNAAEYNTWWAAYFEKTNDQSGYTPVELDETTYQPYTFFERITENGKDKYVICTDKDFDGEKDYYDILGPDSEELAVINGNLGYYVGETPEELEVGKVFRLRPGYKYNINTDIQYWAINGWDMGNRKQYNASYTIDHYNPDDPTTWEYIDVEMAIPTWGQLAAVAASGITYKLVYERVQDKLTNKEYYVKTKDGEYKQATQQDFNNNSVDLYEVDMSIYNLPVKEGQNYNYDDDYTINTTIDRTYYGTSRGFDSTVWQKTYKDGRDKYVMVAELNSVVPTFDVEADAPTSVPLTPHFDPDSNNVYYKLHVQPSWGIRTKFAHPGVNVPRINSNGQIIEGGGAHARIDGITYPSDQTTTWESDFYDKYNDEKSHKVFSTYDDAKTNGVWVDAYQKGYSDIPAAIYFNKAGFDPTRVTHSSDLITQGMPSFNETIAKHWSGVDKIELTPTGNSGMLYDNHAYGTQTTPRIDTQEFSVMLPSLGDTVSKIWDMVFGGRDTNPVIKQTHKRNLDYEWEDARKGLDRHGLRMVGTEIFNGFNKSEVNTLAGCINSVHDLMGMVIASYTASELASNLEELDEDYIYYILQDEEVSEDELVKSLQDKAGKFAMKQRTYKYTPVSDDDEEVFKYEEVKQTDDNFDLSLYYVSDGKGGYRAAEEGDTGPFYAKTVQSSATYEEISGDLTPFDGRVYYYNDGCSLDTDLTGDALLKMSDWIREPEYQSGRKYYSITDDMLVKVDVSQSFTPGTFYFKTEDGSYELSFDLEADPDIDYYIINHTKIRSIDEFGYDNVYSPGVYFYQDKLTDSFKIDIDDDGVWDSDGDGKTNLVTHYEAILNKASEDETVTIQIVSYVNDKGEKKGDPGVKPITFTQAMIENFDPSSYWVERQDKVMVPYNGAYNKDIEFWYQQVTLQTQPASGTYTVGDQVVLTPYVKYTFYKIVNDDRAEIPFRYEHLTAQGIRDIVSNQTGEKIYVFGVIDNWESTASGNIFDGSKIDKSDSSKWACQPQNIFYVPGLYHYLNEDGEYADYILDMYETMWHQGSYYQFKTAPVLVDKKFYEPYKYYTQINGEYVMIKDALTADQLEDYKGNIYEKETYYVYEDKAKIFQPGMEWNSNVSIVPPTVTLASRTEAVELRTLDGFARDLNTIHGLILKINRLLLLNDKFTRDERTLQGTINLLNDKIAQFGKQTPNEVMVVDSYGRTQSANTYTLQKDTASLVKNQDVVDSENKGILADTYKTAASVGVMRGQWITVNIDSDPNNPKFTVHHNFQAVENKPYTTNLNDGTNTITLYNPIIDAMGHTVGTKMNTVTLPYGFKKFTTNGSVAEDVVNQLTPNTNTATADNTQDIFNINVGNKWLRAAVADSSTSNVITLAHETHDVTTTAITGETDLDGSQTFVIQDMIFDKAGHITHNQAHTYKLPDGVKYIAVGAASTAVTDGAIAAGTLEANNHVATFNITPNNRWITLKADADSDTLSIGHAFAGSDTGRLYGDASAQTPKFGATFKVPYFGVDEAGHVKTQSEHTVTIPLPSLTDGTGDVMTGLALVPEDGKFTVTKTNVGKLTISDFTLGENREQLTNSDSINLAFAKLQLQINDEKDARTNAINDLDYEDAEVVEEDGKYVYSVKQTDGKIEAVRMALPAKEADPEEETLGYYVSDILQEKGRVSAVRTLLPEYSDEANAEEDDNMFVYSVKQVAGKIEATRKEFNFLSPETTFAYVAPTEEEVPAEGETEVTTPDPETLKTIEWLFAKVAELEARLAILEPQDETPTA